MDPDNLKNYRQTRLEIDLNSIGRNVYNIVNIIGNNRKFMAVVKANAYGHGLIPVSKKALECGAKYLGVATLEEALELRGSGIEAPILILGIILPSQVLIAIENDIEITVAQLNWLDETCKYLLKATKPLKVHVKVDTGMGRIGFLTLSEFKETVNLIKNNTKIALLGIFTHYARADEEGLCYTIEQRNIFSRFLAELGESSLPLLIHSCNSAATLQNEYHGMRDNLFRVGISMYGYEPSGYPNTRTTSGWLRPAFSLYTAISCIKKVPRGSSIGYGGHYVSSKEEWIGTLPIGYADGWRRSLTGQDVLVNGRRTPLVGNICMDQCMVRLDSPVPEGTEVILIGSSGLDRISVEEIALKMGTSVYEVLCSISNRVPRTYFDSK